MSTYEIIPYGTIYRFTERSWSGRSVTIMIFPDRTEARRHLLDRITYPTDEEIDEILHDRV